MAVVYEVFFFEKKGSTFFGSKNVMSNDFYEQVFFPILRGLLLFSSVPMPFPPPSFTVVMQQQKLQL